jgi:pimeloyl-ACP methyl ester carboxylesterase
MTARVAGAASSAVLLPGFEYRRMDVDGVSISYAVRGAGSPPLLLHGYPENHLTWRDVAPALAEDHTVVLADLRGYGDSGKPARPVLVLWGEHSHVARCYEPLSVWQQYAADVRGFSLPAGHFVPEEAPDLVSAALRDFLD